MKNFSFPKSLFFLFLLTLTIFAFPSAAHAKSPKFEEIFKNKDACFVLYDVRKNKVVKRFNEERCAERVPACSTFIIPLALAAFDKGVLADENTSFPWDGRSYGVASWERDQTAASWVRDSVVWYSQKVAPLIGQQTLESYLAGFNYGTHDLSGGLTTAWSTATPVSKGIMNSTLLISANEQVEFLKRLWKNNLPVSKRSSDIVKKLTYMESSPKGFAMSGKTGSGFTSSMERLGWFVAHLQKGKKEFIAVISYTDKSSTPPTTYAGLEAKALMKDVLTKMKKW